jgi:hypothetical protein
MLSLDSNLANFSGNEGQQNEILLTNRPDAAGGNCHCETMPVMTNIDRDVTF